jgi:DAK2 domain fusion protein YloV
MARAGLVWLEENYQHVNALNVFPVPDGDTGTNMLLTMRSALNRVEDNTDEHVGRMAGQLAQGALMGARGNSGVILSQIWRGLAQSLSDKPEFDVHDLALALKQASDTAYKGVMRPVEGTVLTVIRAGAEEAAEAARKSEDLRFVMERVVERCQQALEHTPEQLSVLKQAGVVDSGGQGLVYILEGMLRYAQGQLSLEGRPAGGAAPIMNTGTLLTQESNGRTPAQALVLPDGGDLEHPYDVQFILIGEDLDVLQVRDAIDAMGDSTVVVGDETTIKVHIHVKDPGRPLTYGASLGMVMDVVVENMQAQMEEIVGNGDAFSFAEVNAEPYTAVQPGQIAVVAVTPGAGLAHAFRSLGAAYVVNGGQTNNPSTEEIFQAIEGLPTDHVIILPNNKNIFLASEAARDLCHKKVVVVPTRSVPQGLSALLALKPDGDLETVAQAMEAAAAQVSTGELTRATRTVTLDGVSVEEGAIIGLVDGRLCASDDTIEGVLDQMLRAMAVEERELATIYYGADTTEADAIELAGRIKQANPDIEVEIVAGGQAHYFFILGLE